MKKLLIGLMVLAISFQTFALSETAYYPTGEVSAVGKFVNGKISEATLYHKTGEVKQVKEYINGELSKATIYHKTGEIKEVQEYVDGKLSHIRRWR